MAVELSFDRKAIEITWDTDLVIGATVEIKTSSGDDVSGRTHVQNDGRATLTYPFTHTGTTHVEVIGSESGADEGDITV